MCGTNSISAIPVLAFEPKERLYRKIIQFQVPPPARAALHAIVNDGSIWASWTHVPVIDLNHTRNIPITLVKSGISASQLHEAVDRSPDVLSSHPSAYTVLGMSMNVDVLCFDTTKTITK